MTVPQAAKPFVAFVRSAAIKHRLPPELILAVMAAESGFKANAYRVETRIKDASYGLMQVLGRTARGLGYVGVIEDSDPVALTGLFDPATSIDLGAQVLSDGIQQTGTIAGAVSAYNGGYRPHLGFGRPAAHPLRICLAYDQVTEECRRWRQVKAGEFSNQPYVNAVVGRMQVYTGHFGPDAA